MSVFAGSAFLRRHFVAHIGLLQIGPEYGLIRAPSELGLFVLQLVLQGDQIEA